MSYLNQFTSSPKSVTGTGEVKLQADQASKGRSNDSVSDRFFRLQGRALCIRIQTAKLPSIRYHQMA
jgi:hypothetical protein